MTVPVVTHGPSLCNLHHYCARRTGVTVDYKSNQQDGRARRTASLLPSTDIAYMQEKLRPIERIPVRAAGRIDLSQTAPSVRRASVSGAPASSVQVGQAQRRELPGTFLQLEHRPLSAYDDNPVFDECSAARFLGVSADCLKKWRQRMQGPDYIQYGKNGMVRYELNALMEFRDRHRVKLDSKK